MVFPNFLHCVYLPPSSLKVFKKEDPLFSSITFTKAFSCQFIFFRPDSAKTAKYKSVGHKPGYVSRGLAKKTYIISCQDIKLRFGQPITRSAESDSANIDH